MIEYTKHYQIVQMNSYLYVTPSNQTILYIYKYLQSQMIKNHFKYLISLCSLKIPSGASLTEFIQHTHTHTLYGGATGSLQQRFSVLLNEITFEKIFLLLLSFLPQTAATTSTLGTA